MTLSINDSMPAFAAVMLREPPFRNKPAATVWLPARRFTSTFSPLTSNSVTSAACRAMRPCRSGVWGAVEGVCANTVVAAATTKQISDKVISSHLPFIIFHFSFVIFQLSFLIYCKSFSSLFHVNWQMKNAKCQMENVLLTDQFRRRYLHLLLRFRRDQCEPHMRFSLYVSCDVPADVVARCATKIWQE